MKQKFTKLFNPKSIAIVGASADKKKIGHIIMKNLLEEGYDGEVYLINPHRKKIQGNTVYSSLKAIGKEIDCTVVAVPGDVVEGVVVESSQFCKNFIVISAGFGENGVEGHNRESRLHEFARKNKITILGPNCLGIIMPHTKLNASFATGMPQKGRVALISQSGALAVALMDRANEDHLGFSSVVTIGNKMMIGASETISYFSDDPETDIIALYLEGINNGDKFLKALKKAHEKGKRVVILKSGITAEGMSAIALHTGSLAGEDEIFDAAVKKFGAIRANSIEHFFAVIRCAQYISDAGQEDLRIGVITNAGGPGVIVTDLISKTLNVSLARLKKEKSLLREKLPQSASVMNPIDLLGDADNKRYRDALNVLDESENVDLIFIVLTPQDATPVKKITQSIIEFAKNSEKTYITTFIGGERVRSSIVELNKNNVLHFDTPAVVLSAIGDLRSNFQVFSSKKQGKKKSDPDLLNKIVQKYSDGDVLYYVDALDIAKEYDLKIAPICDVTEGIASDMKLSFPCVVKIDDPTIVHKTDVGGVIANIKNLKELSDAVDILKKKFPQETAKMIVQKMHPIDLELIIGMKRDPVFGVVVIAGLGGIYTEYLHMVEYFVAPRSQKEVVYQLKNSVFGFLFEKNRGEKCYNVEKLASTILNIYLLGKENKKVKAIDINPYFAYNSDYEDIIVDLKMLIQKNDIT